jgi:hypothetical protein
MLPLPDTCGLFQQVPSEIGLIAGVLLISIIHIHGLHDYVFHRRFGNALELMEGIA